MSDSYFPEGWPVVHPDQLERFHDKTDSLDDLFLRTGARQAADEITKLGANVELPLNQADQDIIQVAFYDIC
ncbi:MAG: hypothetical protein JKX96_00770, partial [Acinetobacter sp.]|nr:hypothetical protein [Acinetobacter sp.]